MQAWGSRCTPGVPKTLGRRARTSGPVKPGVVAKKVQPTILDNDLEFVPDVVRLKPNTRLEGTPYEIIRWLGEGGMGLVFEAHHIDLDRRVALKVLRSSDVTPVADLFRQEAKALAKVGSSYVVQVFDFVSLRDGRLMIAMELIDGQMLSDVPTESVPLERLIPILRQACKGLAAAHRVGIVHRDIKPANIALVQRDGRDDAVTLLDFGVAQFQGMAQKRMAGTPGYVAPEVIGGLEGDTRADLYAIGCVAYLYTAGRAPFTEKDPSKLLLAHLSSDPEPPSVYADVPEPLDRLIMRCLEKNPKDRFEDAADLEAALCEVQIELKLHTPWDDLPIPDVEPGRRARLVKAMPKLVRRQRQRPTMGVGRTRRCGPQRHRGASDAHVGRPAGRVGPDRSRRAHPPRERCSGPGVLRVPPAGATGGADRVHGDPRAGGARRHLGGAGDAACGRAATGLR